MIKKTSSAFTLIELLVVISIIAILAALAVPALTSALTKGQMTGTMNNAKQLYLAAFQMATDGATNSDPNYSWPGDASTPPATLPDYFTTLVRNDYVKPGDLQKMLNAPGATCTVATTGTGNTTAVTLTGNSALKVYMIKDSYQAGSIFAATSNFTYNTDLSPTGIPYADKGFVVMRKGGDAGIFKKGQAKAGTTGTKPNTAYQSTIGRLTNDADDTLGTETKGTNVLTYP